MKLILFILLLLSSTGSAQHPATISVIDFVKVKDNKFPEAGAMVMAGRS